MITLSQLIGQPTISLSDAETTGRVEGVRLQGGRIVALHTGVGLVPAGAVRTFEGDAVTFDGTPEPIGDAGAADSPIGRRVLDEEGDELGRLADLRLEADGVVTEVLLDDGRAIDGSLLRVVGSFAVIVAAMPDTTPSVTTGGSSSSMATPLPPADEPLPPPLVT